MSILLLSKSQHEEGKWTEHDSVFFATYFCPLIHQLFNYTFGVCATTVGVIASDAVLVMLISLRLTAPVHELKATLPLRRHAICTWRYILSLCFLYGVRLWLFCATTSAVTSICCNAVTRTDIFDKFTVPCGFSTQSKVRLKTRSNRQKSLAFP